MELVAHGHQEAWSLGTDDLLVSSSNTAVSIHIFQLGRTRLRTGLYLFTFLIVETFFNGHLTITSYNFLRFISGIVILPNSHYIIVIENS